ncbi:MAG: PqqD family protein, partial [Candidatus Omnitrophota bacterium]
KGFKNLDLVHIDAHMDFGFHQAKPIERILNGARSLKELKSNLEYSLALKRGNQGLFNKLEEQCLLSLATAEFKIDNMYRARKLLLRYQSFEHLDAQNHYLLGRIYEEETILLPIYKTSDEINCIYTLNKAASRVWELLDGKRMLAELKDKLLKEFDGTPEEVDKETRKLAFD